MSELDWSTPEGLAAIKDHLAAQIEGWCPPIAYAVGLSSASSSGEWEFLTSTDPAVGTGCRQWCSRRSWGMTARPGRCR